MRARLADRVAGDPADFVERGDPATARRTPSSRSVNIPWEIAIASISRVGAPTRSAISSVIVITSKSGTRPR